jgi:hypothetical protein
MYKKNKSFTSLLLCFLFMLQIFLPYNTRIIASNEVNSGYIIDDMMDSSKMFFVSPEMLFQNWEPNRYDNDNYRLAVGTANPGVVIYKTPQKIDSFLIDIYRMNFSGSSAPATYKFFVSPDNVTYKEVFPWEKHVNKVIVDGPEFSADESKRSIRRWIETNLKIWDNSLK